ncbi:UDP-N-acetylglucosamine transferase subunit ALG14 isoform 2 [Schistosoma japonicum]|uniref:UDP-N-acetylglucosamine transferase subunit ALG14 n=1 Tax=Schistosoma japonicum TaxID=6182 RepID=A0A4Z2D7Z5_SCHJA|nr:UDP-N-acetylglucosamine transferase subunit ALG14 isoform 2 [Schistosoma japonicum]
MLILYFILGGHTAEMLSYVSVLTPKYQPRTYVIAATDSISEQKVFNLEDKSDIEFSIKRIRRAREVKQSYVSSIFTTLMSFLSAFPIFVSCRPKLILCNGPGTCIPVCFVALLLQMLRLHSTLIIFVESICRTKTLSLSGKILYHTHLVDVIVQWPELKTKYPKSIYLGLLS